MKLPKLKIPPKKTLLKISVIFIAVAVLLSCVPLILNAYVKGYASDYIYTDESYKESEFDCVLVLGAGVWGDTPSHLLEERLTTGVSVYKTGCTNRILMSGDHGQEDYDEVNVMKAFAVENDIDSSHVFMDHAGFSTYESMYRARDVFKVKKVLIVTQEYHLYRAVYDARKLGLDAYGIAAGSLYNFSVATNTYNDTREMLARCKDFIYCIIQPEPTYLGEAIPISSNGNLTDDKGV